MTDEPITWEPMTDLEAIAQLDALGTDGEAAHAAADRILREYLPPPVADAYERVMERADFWAFA